MKAVLLGSLVVLIAALGGSVLWFRHHLPPNCTDPRTIALVRHSLVTTYHLPPATNLAYIRTLAGGFLAMRFVCQSEIAGIDPHQLPPGTPMPGWVQYTARLTPDRHDLEVTVTVQPLLEWKQLQ